MPWPHLACLYFLSLPSPRRAHPPPASHLNATNFSTICRHCDPSPFHRTSPLICSKAISYQAQMKSWTNLWSPPPCPFPPCPFPPCSPSLWPLHLCTSSSSVAGCGPSLLRHRVISLPLSAKTTPLPAPPPCSVLLLPLSARLESALTPLPLFIIPHPTRPVATTALLRFKGLLRQLPGGKRKNDETIREEPCGEKWNI